MHIRIEGTEAQNFLQRYEQKRQQEKEAWEQEKPEKKADILTRLRSLGIHEVTVHYSGGGDQGGIEEIETDAPSDDGYDADTGLNDAIEQFCLDELEHQDFDWVNNEGGFGEITINVDAGTITPNHHQNTTRYVTWEV